MRRLSALIALCALQLGSNVAWAEEPKPLSPVEFNRDIDAPILAATGFTWLATQLLQPTMVTPSCPCSASDVNALDRGLAGRHNSVADAISWGSLGLLVAGPLVADGIDVARNGGGGRAWAHDAGIYVEALAINGALNQIVKLAVQRPRPFLYDPNVTRDQLASSESYVSFYSEHSSIAFTAASAYTTLFALRHPDRKGATVAVGLLTFALAGTTAALRVVAGKHYYTDVTLGALVGSGIGAAVPLLHRRKSRIPPITIAPLEGGAMAVLTLIN